MKRKHDDKGEALDFDVDDSALMRGPGSSRSSRKRWFPPGPSTLPETLHAMEDQVRALVEHARAHDPMMLANLKTWLQQDHVFTSSFSGLGTFELATHRVRVELGKMLPDVPLGRSVHYSASENSGEAILCLKALPLEVRPMHIFTNIEDRLPAGIRNDLKPECDKIVQLAKDAFAEYRLGTMSKAELLSSKKSLSRRMRDLLMRDLATVEFEEKAYCCIHDGQCPLTPRGVKEYKHFIWTEAAGTVCCPFSGRSNNAYFGWCDDTALTTMTWAYSTRFAEPDRVLHECVEHFPTDTFKTIFEDRDAMKSCQCPRPADSSFITASHVFSPVDMGLPCERTRVYTDMILSQVGKVTPLPLEFDAMFNRSLVTSAAIYLVAPQHMKDAEVRLAASRSKCRHLRRLASGDSADAESLRGLDMLTPTELGRLEGYQLKWEASQADQARGSSPDSPDTMLVAVVDVSQESSHDGRIMTQQLPALLRKSRFVNLVTREPVYVCELWLAMGHRRLDLLLEGSAATGGASESNDFPPQSLLAELSLPAQRSLLGNCMHMDAIGMWHLFSIARCAPVPVA